MNTGLKKFSRKVLSTAMAVLTAATSAVIAVPSVTAVENNSKNHVSIYYDGKETDSLVVSQNDKATVKAVADANGSCKYQWQILADEKSGTWANIYDATSESLEVSYSMTAALLDDSGSVYLRCKVSNSNDTTTSDTLHVTTSFIHNEKSFTLSGSKDTSKAATSKAANVKKAAKKSISTYSENLVTVTINYLDSSTGNEVYSAYTAQIEKGKEFKQSVVSPTYLGYMPYWNKSDLSNSNPDKASDKADTLDLDIKQVSSDTTINVYYKATEVPYSIEYFFQNVYDNGYTVDTALTKKSYAVTGTIIDSETLHEPVKDKEGFSPLYHIPVSIAGDGSTVINSYYDRNYYLFTFDLDGGYGTEPVYARYDSSFLVNEPIRAGYVFKGWELVSEDGRSVERGSTRTAAVLPTNMPAENRTYKAIWKSAETTFTVVYWKQNPDDNNYGYWDSKEYSAMSSDVIDGNDYKELTDNIKNKIDPYNYIRYNFARADKNVTVNGDGSTVVNVYYDRKIYTLRFIYARDDLETNKHYVKGGTTYRFGSGEGGMRIFDNPEYLVDGSFLTYLLSRDDTAGANGAWGEVNEIPKLKDEILNKTVNGKKVYKLGSFESTMMDSLTWKNWAGAVTTVSPENKGKTYKYYYVEFSGRYEQNISDIWLTDPFKTVTLNESELSPWNNKKKYYFDKNAPHATTSKVIEKSYFAGWNGEHFVKYSYRNNGNQTIKGNYRRLDDEVIYDIQGLKKYYPNEQEHSTVYFLGFFDNGSNSLNWNIPRKWIYECYVPSINNQKTNYLKDGIYYNMIGPIVNYDDNAQVIRTDDKGNITQLQTPTALRGFTYKDFIQDPAANSGNNQFYRGGKIIDDPNDDADGLESFTAKFYYTRNKYNLKFYNYTHYENAKGQTSNVGYGEDIEYEQPLKNKNFTPSYPSVLEKNAYEFGGWYTSPGCYAGSEVDWDTLTMPAENLTLYAKWIPVDHSVRIFENYSSMVDFENEDVTDDDIIISRLDSIEHSETKETSAIWLQLLGNAKPNNKGVYTVSYDKDERTYVKSGNYFYRLGRFDNSVFTYTGKGKSSKYIYVDDGTRKGYVRADGLIEIRHQGHGNVIGGIDVPKDPSGADHVFSGWKFIKDSKVAAFSPLDYLLTNDLSVYADWGSQASVPYVIHYALETGVDNSIKQQLYELCPEPYDNTVRSLDDGSKYVYLDADGLWHKIIANDTEGFRFEGTTHTFDPKTGAKGELFDEYSNNYYPTVASHSIQMENDEIGNVTNNVFTFTYAKVSEITYTVEYRYNTQEKPLINNKTYSTGMSGNYGKKTVTTTSSVVTERFQVVPDYVPDDTYKTLVLSVTKDENGNYVSSPDNVITFYYTKNVTVAPYVVHYMMQKPSTSGSNYKIDGSGDYTEETGSIIKGIADIGEISVNPLIFDGFTLDTDNAVVVDGATKKESKAAYSAQNGFEFEVTADGNELYIFYKRNTTSYKVYYLRYGTDITHLDQISTDDMLKDTKSVSNCEYGVTVTEEAPQITGMTWISKKISIKLSQDESLNTIVFFYTPLQYIVEYKPWKIGGGTVSHKSETVNGGTSATFGGSTAAASTGYDFGGWYVDEDGKTAVSDYAPKLADVDGNKVTPIIDNLIPNGRDGHTSTVFYARFNPKGGYEVRYDLNGGKIGSSETASPKTNVYWNSSNLGTKETPTKDGYGFVGWKFEKTDIDENTTYGELAKDDTVKYITLVAQWTETKVYFHENLDETSTEDSTDIFRTYTYSDSKYKVTNGKIAQFYDIPSVKANTKIFGGWYYKDGTPMKYTDTFAGEVHLFAHWVAIDSVDKTADDTKQTALGSTYKGFDLFGTQIRNSDGDENYPGGIETTPAYSKSGLRFVTSISESLIGNLCELNDKTLEYGYVLAKTDTAKKGAERSGDAANYKLEYKDTNVNGVDTSKDYGYVQNINCTSKVGGLKGNVAYDHFNNETNTYRIYSLVVTYNKSSSDPDKLAKAKASDVVARSYIRYTDANGLLRTYYNDYTGTNVFGGCSTSFKTVYDIMNPETPEE